MTALRPMSPMLLLLPGNDLSRTFLWGDVYDRKWIKGYKAMYKTLNRVRLALAVAFQRHQQAVRAVRAAY